MSKNALKFFFLFTLMSVNVYTLVAQNINFNSQKNWSLNKKELIFTVGATQFTGDLGGAGSYGHDYSLYDWDWPSVSYTVGVGYRYRFHPKFATTTTLNLVNVKGDDALSEEPIRKARNLNFKSNMFELHQRIEYILFSVERFSPSFSRPGEKHGKVRNQQYYVFGGIGGTYFNPKGKYQGDWVSLRPLKTEGQAKPYLPIALSAPLGFGFRFGLGTSWRMGIEASYVIAFTDYLDDVSTVYADPASLDGPIAQYLSNPSDQSVTVGPGFNWFGAGYQRGDKKQTDAYYHLNIVFIKNLTYKDYGRQRIKNVGGAKGVRIR